MACLKEAFGERLERLEKGGVVHSFTGTVEEMGELMELGLYIGLNGCSFKTAENCEVVKAVRLDRLMVETDGPWCEVRPTHDGWKYLVEMEKKEREQAAAEAEAAAAAATSQPQLEAQAQSSAELSAKNGASDTVSTDAAQRPRPPRQKKQPQQSSKKPQKKESEVTERFKVVKKEKWVEGAMVKGRNEPCTIERVAKIIAGIKGVSVEDVCEAAWQNTMQVFDLKEKV